MMKNVDLMQAMSSMASYASQRHAVIAENIANADTPNYQAKDLQPFSEIYAHMDATGQTLNNLVDQLDPIIKPQAGSPNGNSVSLEQQLMLSSEVKGEHEMALAIYRKSLDMMKLAMGKNI